MAYITDIEGVYGDYLASNCGPYLKINSVRDDGDYYTVNGEAKLGHKYDGGFTAYGKVIGEVTGPSAGSGSYGSGSPYIDYPYSQYGSDSTERYDDFCSQSADKGYKSTEGAREGRIILKLGNSYINSDYYDEDHAVTASTGGFTIPQKTVADTPAPQTTGDIVYNPMNGTWNLPTQTKEKDQTLLLHSDIPVRQGFVFKNWNTRPDGSGITYNPDDSYIENKPLMLFAQGEKTNFIANNKKYITKENFINFINSIKNRLIPRDIGFNYIVNEGIFQSVNTRCAGASTSHQGWGQGRHGNDGTAEAGGYCGGQTGTGNSASNTNIYMELPKGIFIDCPIMIMTPQIQDIQGAFPNYQDVHTITQSDIDFDSQGAGKLGVTYINSYLNDDTVRGARNFGVRYYLRGSWK